MLISSFYIMVSGHSDISRETESDIPVNHSSPWVPVLSLAVVSGVEEASGVEESSEESGESLPESFGAEPEVESQP